MSADFHSSGKNSFYSNVVRLSGLYNLPDFDPIFSSPRMLLSFATCTYSAQFLNARHNNLHIQN